MTAKEYLEQLKAEIEARQEENGAILRKYGKGIAELEEALRSVDYMQEFLLNPIWACLFEEEKRCLAGTETAIIPLDTMTAKSIRVNQSEHLVVMNERLLALIWTYHEIQFLAVKKLLRGDAEPPQRFSAMFAPLIDSYLTVNSGAALPIYSGEEFSEEERQCILQATVAGEQLILAHELAHIALGHFEERTEEQSATERSFKYGAFTYGQEKEYEADAQALRWISRMIETATASTRLPLPMYLEVFVLFHLIECNLGFPDAQASHPSALARMRHLRTHCAPFFDTDGIQFMDRMIKSCEDTESFRIT